MSNNKAFFSPEDLRNGAASIVRSVRALGYEYADIYAIPNGGNILGGILSEVLKLPLVCQPGPSTLIVDDIMDSGKTIESVCHKFNLETENVAVLHVREGMVPPSHYHEVVPRGVWVDYFWEKQETAIEDHITRIIQYIGDDPTREGVLETPARVVKSWKELFSGYQDDAGKHLSKHFASDCNEMVICKDIEFYSMCEHHMLPFVGRAHIGYIPGGRVVGLSKLARTVEVYARRLQIQEQLGEQISDALMEHIPKIKGCMVVLDSKHFCMCARGVGKQNSTMITSSIKGPFKEPAVRAEFLSLIKD